MARNVSNVNENSSVERRVYLEYDNSTYNVAQWLGFMKTSDEISLPYLVRWNIVYILTVTLWSVVLIRQYNYRVARGKPTNRPFFIFPRIKRSDADKNLINCVKYLVDYGYYKFGVEVSSFFFLDNNTVVGGVTSNLCFGYACRFR